MLELRHHDVDVNPDYADHFDIEIFSMHLVFEMREVGEPTNDSAIDNGNIRRLPLLPRVGLDAFEAGLDEVSVLLDTRKRSSEVNARLLLDIQNPSSRSRLKPLWSSPREGV